MRKDHRLADIEPPYSSPTRQPKDKSTLSKKRLEELIKDAEKAERTQDHFSAISNYLNITEDYIEFLSVDMLAGYWNKAFEIVANFKGAFLHNMHEIAIIDLIYIS